MRPRGRFQGFELLVDAGYPGGTVEFKDIPQLRSDTDKDAVIYNIQTYSVESVPKTFNGNPVATMAQLQNSFLTLYITGSEALFNVSLLKFLNIQNNGAAYFNGREYFESSPLRVDWTQSYIRFAVPGTGVTPQYSFLFDFTYEWLPAGSYAAFLQLQSNKWASGIIH